MPFNACIRLVACVKNVNVYIVSYQEKRFWPELNSIIMDMLFMALLYICVIILIILTAL